MSCSELSMLAQNIVYLNYTTQNIEPCNEFRGCHDPIAQRIWSAVHGVNRQGGIEPDSFESMGSGDLPQIILHCE